MKQRRGRIIMLFATISTLVRELAGNSTHPKQEHKTLHALQDWGGGGLFCFFKTLLSKIAQNKQTNKSNTT